jgi:signal transduction histidine kinase
LEITIKDYGCGVNTEKITRHKEGGGGEGLSIHQTMMTIIGGSLQLESVPGEFTKVSLKVPKSEITAH